MVGFPVTARRTGRVAVTLFAGLTLACVGRNPNFTESTSGGSTSDATRTTSAGSTVGSSVGTTEPTGSGSQSSSGSSNSSGTVTTSGLECEDLTDLISSKPADLMFVVDKSGSMVSEPWDHDGDPNTPDRTRWSVLHELVGTTLYTLPDEVGKGLVLFPSMAAQPNLDFSACPVADIPEATLGASADYIMQQMPGPMAGQEEIIGGTPTFEGIKRARYELANWGGGGPPLIVLITDGVANCKEPCNGEPFDCYFEELDGRVITEVQNALFQDGILTMVIGINIRTDPYPDNEPEDGKPDGVIPADFMDSIALAGGNLKQGLQDEDDPRAYFDAEDEETLGQAFGFITHVLGSCLLVAEGVGEPGPGFLEVELDDVPIPEISLDDCGPGPDAGWAYLDVGEDAIVLCGKACSDYKGSPESLEVGYCEGE